MTCLRLAVPPLLLLVVLLQGCGGRPPLPALPPPTLGGPALADAERVEANPLLPLCVLAFNDLHGNLSSPGSLPPPGGGEPVPVGGADALAGALTGARADCPNRLVVAAGDLVGASPLVSAAFHDEPTVEVMNRLGLDATSVGNHEFDAGWHELLRKQQGGCRADLPRSCQGASVGMPVPFEGAHYPILAANVFDRSNGHTILPAYVIRRVEGVPVALIGLTLAATPSIVPAAAIRDLEFRDEADTVNALIPEIEAQGVHAIVVLIHQGGQPGPSAATSPDPFNACPDALQDDARSPIRAVMARLDDRVDLVISGHSHTAYVCAFPNRAGRPVIVTQALSFGRVLTRIDTRLDRRTGHLTVVAAHNQLVTRERLDPEIGALIERYQARVAVMARKVLGWTGGPVDSVRSATGESRAGVVIADAQLAATAAAADGGAVMAWMNAGGVRGAGWEQGPWPHAVSYGEAFTLQPFGNRLVVLDLTAEALHRALEQAFPGCGGQTVPKVLQPSRGVHVVWRASAPACAHIRELSLTREDGSRDVLIHEGEVIDPQRRLRITVNDFLAGGGDGFTEFAAARQVAAGVQDIDALASYLGRFPDASVALDAKDAALGRPRIERQP